MSQDNFHELLYIVISSGLAHGFFLVLTIYVVYRYWLVETVSDMFKDLLTYYGRNFLEASSKEISSVYQAITGQTMSKDENIKVLRHIYPYPSEVKQQEALKELKESEDYNQNLYDISNYIVISLSICLVGFMTIYAYFYRSRINLKISLFEIIVGLIITFIILAVYEYLFITYFVIPINHIPYSYFIENLIYFKNYNNKGNNVLVYNADDNPL